MNKAIATVKPWYYQKRTEGICVIYILQKLLNIDYSLLLVNSQSFQVQMWNCICYQCRYECFYLLNYEKFTSPNAPYWQQFNKINCLYAQEHVQSVNADKIYQPTWPYKRIIDRLDMVGRYNSCTCNIHINYDNYVCYWCLIINPDSIILFSYTKQSKIQLGLSL